MPKVGFVSLGCPKNLVDSEVMMGILTRAGYEITPRAGDADVLVVNTCSFIAPAQQESVQSILEMAEYKKLGRAQKLIVAGCMVERYRNDIREQIPEVDAVIGTGEVDKILEACKGQLRNDTDNTQTNAALPSYLYHDLTPRTSKSTKAAIIPAPSASSRSCVENSAAAASNPWCAKRKISPPPVSAKFR